MDDKTLDKWLESHQAPTPRTDLNARILAAATLEKQANDNHRSFARRFLPIAATCLLYTSPSPRDKRQSRMPSSA